jgi:serine protease
MACAAAFAQGAAAPAQGLIIGYRASATDADPEQIDRSPRAGERERAQARWKAASNETRERTRRLAKDVGLSLRGTGEAGNAALLKFDRPLQGRSLEDAMRRVRLHPDVAWVEPNVFVKRLQTVSPNDTRFNDQWHLQIPDLLNNPAALNLPSAWSQTTGSAVVVAVVDGGVRFDHPDLPPDPRNPMNSNSRMLRGYDFVSEVEFANDFDGRDSNPEDPGDWVTRYGNAPAVQQLVDAGLCGDFRSNPNLDKSSWHGTFITGQIAAATNNNIGVAGINWGARILPVRVAGKCGALLSDLLDGMRWAAGLPVSGVPTNTNPARVINLSFGGDRPCGENPAVQETINAATDAGALVVVAAGNDNGALKRPADCQRVMVVASVRKDGAKADYSSFGPQVALSAPGGSDESNGVNLLFSTDNNGTEGPGVNGLGYKQGTSFAVPQAVGVASLMLAVNGALTPSALIERMKQGARPHVNAGQGVCALPTSLVCNCTTTTCGAGLLDAATSVQLATGPAAVIAPIGTVNPGATISLNGTASVALAGTVIDSHQWTQVSGPTVAIGTPQSAVASVSLPSIEATYVFKLTVTDNLTPTERIGSDTVTVVAAYPVVAASSGGGGGSTSLFWGMALWAWVLAVCWQQRPARWRKTL